MLGLFFVFIICGTDVRWILCDCCCRGWCPHIHTKFVQCCCHMGRLGCDCSYF